MYRILLVDDEILVREAIKENMDWSSMDCELVGDCPNGQEAAEFVKKTPVDIVLTDICMPYMDGMELSHFLHDNYPDIVVVIFSGFSEFEYAKKAIQYNVSEYLLKPITAKELQQTIDRMKQIVDERRQEKRRMENLLKASDHLRKNAQVIRSKMFDTLVSGTSDTKEAIQQLESIEVHLCGPWYRVAMFDMDLYSDLYELDMEKRQESALMAFVLYNVSEEILKREGAGYAYREGNNGISVVFEGNNHPDTAAKLLQICQEIQNKVKELIGIDVSMSIGTWVRRPEDLADSHEQAKNGLKLRYLLGGRLLLDMEEQREEGQVNIYDTCRQMAEALRSEKKETMAALLEKMQMAIKAARVNKNRACMYMQQMIHVIGQVQESVETDSCHAFRIQEDYIEKVSSRNSFDGGMEVVKSYAAAVFEQLFRINSTSGHRMALLAVDYIQNNYMDAALSLNHICSYLNISTSHFSTIFKEETGETFMEILIRTRMQKAKELLETTTLKNYEIAERVGFSDPHYFGISFKKMTGKTPTEYAKMFKRSQTDQEQLS